MSNLTTYQCVSIFLIKSYFFMFQKISNYWQHRLFSPLQTINFYIINSDQILLLLTHHNYEINITLSSTKDKVYI